MGGCCAKPSQNDQQPQDNPGEIRIDQPPQQPQNQPGELRKDQPPQQPQNQPGERRIDEVKNCSFQEFFFSELETATKNFSSDKIISENAEESSNVVYKGCLKENLGFVAMQSKRPIPSLEMLKQRDVASSTGQQPEVPDSDMSDMGKACRGLNMEAIWNVLSHPRYADPQPNTHELSFRRWLPRLSKIDDLGEKADMEFRNKNYLLAINRYTEIIRKGNTVFLNVYARRCFCNIVEGESVNALADAIKAEELFPDSPIGFFLHSVILQVFEWPDHTSLFEKAMSLEAKLENREEVSSSGQHEVPSYERPQIPKHQEASSSSQEQQLAP